MFLSVQQSNITFSALGFFQIFSWTFTHGQHENGHDFLYTWLVQIHNSITKPKSMNQLNEPAFSALLFINFSVYKIFRCVREDFKKKNQ